AARSRARGRGGRHREQAHAHFAGRRRRAGHRCALRIAVPDRTRRRPPLAGPPPARGRRRGGGGSSPLGVYGAVSVAHGWPPLPNSLLLKRATFEGSGAAAMFDRLGGHALRTLGEAPHLFVLLAAVILLSARRPASAAVRRWDVLFVTGTLLHLQLAALGWLFRYEAYLVAIGVVL